MGQETLMGTTLRIRTTIQPGKRIEFTAPDLPENGDVDIIVLLPASKNGAGGILDFLESLPEKPHTEGYWQMREKELQEDRDSWDR